MRHQIGLPCKPIVVSSEEKHIGGICMGRQIRLPVAILAGADVVKRRLWTFIRESLTWIILLKFQSRIRNAGIVL